MQVQDYTASDVIFPVGAVFPFLGAVNFVRFLIESKKK